MAIDVDIADDHVDLFERLCAFLQTSGPGPGWTQIDGDTSVNALFRAPGLDGLQEIHVGLSVHASPSDDAYALGVWMARDYNASLPVTSQPGHSGIVYVPLWNTSMPYWAVANGQRLVIIPKVSTTYQGGYAGKILPAGTPGEYPQPYYVAGCVPSPTIRWSTIVEDHRSFFDPGNSALVSTPGMQWRNVQNWREIASGETTMTDGNFAWPFNSYISSDTGSNGNESTLRYRELRENLDGSYNLKPVQLLGVTPDLEEFGDLDGVYACTGFNSGSENTVTIGGVPHLVVQNMHRTARYYYCAVKLE